MAFAAPTQIGTSFNTSNSTASNVIATVGVGGVPLGAFIFLVVSKTISVTTVAASDSKGNTYTQRANNQEPIDNQTIAVLTAPVTVALVSGDTITVNFGATFSGKIARAYYITAAGAISYGSSQIADSAFPHTSKTGGNLANVPVGSFVLGAWTENFAPETWTPAAAYTGLGKVEFSTTMSQFIEYDLDGPTSVGTVAATATVATGSSSAGTTLRFQEASATTPSLVVPHRSTRNALLRR